MRCCQTTWSWPQIAAKSRITDYLSKTSIFMHPPIRFGDFFVIGPTDPVPIEFSSIFVTGMTPPAVEVTKTSSAALKSLGARSSVAQVICNSSQRSKIVWRVIPISTPNSGEEILPSLTAKTLKPGPSAMLPLASRRMAVSAPCEYATYNGGGVNYLFIINSVRGNIISVRTSVFLASY